MKFLEKVTFYSDGLGYNILFFSQYIWIDFSIIWRLYFIKDDQKPNNQVTRTGFYWMLCFSFKEAMQLVIWFLVTLLSNEMKRAIMDFTFCCCALRNATMQNI